MAAALVVYASKYGATRSIAERVGERLKSHGIEVDIGPADTAGDPRTYDAVVAGSALYMFRWLSGMVRYLKRHSRSLADKKLWLFSSGPTTEKDLDEMRGTWKLPSNAAAAVEGLNVQGNEVFGGAADPAQMKGFHRWVWKKVQAEQNDARDWEAMDSWADEIAASLKQSS